MSSEKYTLCECTSEKSVLQNLDLLLSTRKGSVPFYRDFGIDTKFVDRPPEVAKTLIAAEITEAVKRFIPEIEITKFNFTTDNSGRLICKPEVRINI